MGIYLPMSLQAWLYAKTLVKSNRDANLVEFWNWEFFFDSRGNVVVPQNQFFIMSNNWFWATTVQPRLSKKKSQFQNSRQPKTSRTQLLALLFFSRFLHRATRATHGPIFPYAFNVCFDICLMYVLIYV